MRLKSSNSGFTLVEMAIVLVIIGIILAGVMKGRDIVRGAQVKEFSQQFAQKWGTIAQTYYDKTGQNLNDAPKNGGSVTTADGLMDSRLMTSAGNIVNACENVGITPCTLIKSRLLDWTTGNCGAAGTNIFKTKIDGEFTGPSNVIADLVGLNITSVGKTYLRNVVLLAYIPIDVARGLDTAIDGIEDGTTGSFLCFNTGVTTQADTLPYANQAAVTAIAWNAASTGARAMAGIVLDF